MLEDAGSEMKTRLREDLRAAMKDRRTTAAKVIRALVAALDNAEAPPIHGKQPALGYRFNEGSAEIERLRLSSSQVREVILAEIHERERSAAELERLAMIDRAQALREEALLAKRYTDME